MALSWPARLLMGVASAEAIVAVGYAAFGRWPQAGIVGAIAVAVALCGVVINLIQKHHERKSHGRYRKAPEAHRAGAGRSTGDRAGTRYRAHRDAIRTGAGMSGSAHDPFAAIDSAVANMLRANVLRANVISGGISIGPSPVTPDEKPTPRPAGEFDGHHTEFAPGVVTGTRSFDVDKLGRLLGVAYATVWTPGENEAKCMKRDDYAILMGYNDRPRVREADRPPHSIADCGHGFYGYYEGSNDYYAAGRVMGVVEAYGETIIGSRGFRASKARIVALHVPPEISVGKRRLIARNYPEVAIFDSFDAMVSEFPPDDAGHGLNPDTDPEFWTRKA